MLNAFANLIENYISGHKKHGFAIAIAPKAVCFKDESGNSLTVMEDQCWLTIGEYRERYKLIYGNIVETLAKFENPVTQNFAKLCEKVKDFPKSWDEVLVNCWNKNGFRFEKDNLFIEVKGKTVSCSPELVFWEDPIKEKLNDDFYDTLKNNGVQLTLPAITNNIEEFYL